MEKQNKDSISLTRYTACKITACDIQELRFLRETENLRVDCNITKCLMARR